MEDAIRFGVKDSYGRRSSSWKLWRSHSDIYLSARPLRGAFKLSLHESGCWNASFTSEFTRKAPEYFRTKTRHISVCKIPREVERGVTVACRIHIPISELRELENESGRSAQKIRWIDASGEDLSIQFMIVITTSIAHFKKWPGEIDSKTRLLDKISLPNEQSVWVLYRKQPVNRDVPKYIELARKHRDKGITLISNGTVDLMRDSLRLIIIAEDRLGAIIFIEAALNDKSSKGEKGNVY